MKTRKRIRRAVMWLSPLTWPTPKTRLGEIAQCVASWLIVPLWIVFVFWLGTPRH
jgi:hypothetical protein